MTHFVPKYKEVVLKHGFQLIPAGMERLKHTPIEKKDFLKNCWICILKNCQMVDDLTVIMPRLKQAKHMPQTETRLITNVSKHTKNIKKFFAQKRSTQNKQKGC